MLHLTDPAYLPGIGAVGGGVLRSGEGANDLLRARLCRCSRLSPGCCWELRIGVPLGAAMALSRGADGFFGPLIKATYSLPKSALIPLFVLWFGVGGLTNILAATLTTLLPIVIYTYHGVHGVPQIFVWSAQAFGTPRGRMLARIMLPAALPAILTGIRIALGFSFIVTIAAEMIVSNYGIGKLMFFYGDSGAYNYMFAAVITVVVAAFIADRIFVAISDYVLRWQEPADRDA